MLQGDELKSTKFWVAVFSVILLASIATSLLLYRGRSQGAVANIYQNGVCIYSIDLSGVKEAYTLEITGEVTNIITVEQGSIRVLEATCPDLVCVHQGWIANGVVPIVCLPNSLIIRIENAPATGPDAVAN